MASLRRKPNSKFWIACFTDQHGQQRQWSTKETRRDVAQKIADNNEAAYARRLTEAQARKALATIYQEVRGEPLFHDTARIYLTNWAKSREREVSRGSKKRYDQIIEDFLESLGKRADEDFAYVTRNDLTAFRDQIATRSTPSNANTCIKILRIPFAQAFRDGVRPDNPALAVKKLTVPFDPNATERRGFTAKEIKKLLKVADQEWRGMIFAGAYTGQRLGDIASWPWRKFNMASRVIEVRTQKTGRPITVPIAKSFFKHLKTLPAHSPTDSVFPRASKKRLDAKGESRALSNEFYGLLVKAGLAPKRSKKNTGKGHSGKRNVNELGFHSFRHTATSWLKKAGVPESVARDIIGHDSPVISRRYTHVTLESKRAAIDKLPDDLEK